MKTEIEQMSPSEPVQDVKAAETNIEVKQEPPQHPSLASSLMRGDRVLWGIYFLLIVISIVEMFSASSTLTYKAASTSDPTFRHIRHILFGLVVMIVSQNMGRKAFPGWGFLIYILGMILVILLPVLGTDMKGAHRDILGIQPVELIKIGTVLLVAMLITQPDIWYQRLGAFFRHNTPLKRYLLLLFTVALPCIFMAPQNLSSAIIIGLASFFLMFLGEVPWRYLWRTLTIVAIVGALGIAALYGLHAYTESCHEQGVKPINLGLVNRAYTWENRLFGNENKPLWEQDVDGDNSQVIHAHMALANSYPFGRFIGNSKLRDYLPEAYSDYIYAIIFEELGWEGATFVLFLYAFLLWRCYIIARKSRNFYHRLIMVGLPLIILIQALIHIGVCTGAMFVTGQPLPLISRGGSSIIFTSLSFGLMFAMSRIIENEGAGEEETPAADNTILNNSQTNEITS